MAELVLDVSNVNGPIDWSLVARPQKLGGAGINAAFIKATEGLTFNDKNFVTNRGQARLFGVHVGAYHFARPDLHPYEPEAEAKHFCAIVGKLGMDDLRPVLDLEVHPRTGSVVRPHPLSQAQLVSWARKWNAVVKKQLGVWPIFYSYSSFIQEMHAETPIGGGLWLANYGSNDGREHPYQPPAPWKKVLAHQFTSRAHLPGHAGYVDFSIAASIRPLLAHPFLSQIPPWIRFGL